MTQTTIVLIEDTSQVAVARRVAADFAQMAGLEEQRCSAAQVVAVELANNLLQHAGGGKLYFQYLPRTGALDLAAVDHGRGMASVQHCLADGYSTASTPGLGLGAVRRFALRFGAYSVPGRTTVVAARMAEREALPEFSVVCKAVEGETFSGDSWAVSEDGLTFLVVDGLGHGVLAADAAKEALGLFASCQTMEPQAILERLHAGMRSTRGAAGAVVRIRPELRQLEFCGIGNIGCAVCNSVRSQSMVSHNGTLGHQVRKFQQFTYSYEPRDLLLMQSDGLVTHNKLGVPPMLLVEPPFAIAPFLYSEQVRGRDDATLLVNRLG